MKDASNKAYYDYWDFKRGFARAPDRNDMHPDDIRSLLGSIFVAGCDMGADLHWRVAGTRLCAMFGSELKGTPLMQAFAPASRPLIKDILDVVIDDTIVAVVGLRGEDNQGTLTAMEMLVLPLRQHSHLGPRVTGSIRRQTSGIGPVGDINLTSHRYIEPAVRPLLPRIIRKLEVARGLMVYEGLR